MMPIAHIRTTYARLVEAFGPASHGPDGLADLFSQTKQSASTSQRELPCLPLVRHALCRWDLALSDGHEFSLVDGLSRQECSNVWTPRGEHAWCVIDVDRSHMPSIRKMVPRLHPSDATVAYELCKDSNGYPSLKVFRWGQMSDEIAFDRTLSRSVHPYLTEAQALYGTLQDIDIEENGRGADDELRLLLLHVCSLRRVLGLA